MSLSPSFLHFEHHEGTLSIHKRPPPHPWCQALCTTVHPFRGFTHSRKQVPGSLRVRSGRKADWRGFLGKGLLTFFAFVPQIVVQEARGGLEMVSLDTDI